MSTALDRCAAATRAYADGRRFAFKATASGGGSGVSEGSILATLAAGYGLGNTFGGIGQIQSLQHHAEQLRHNIGTPATCIRAITNRICGQPTRVARHKKKAARLQSQSSPGRPKPKRGGEESLLLKSWLPGTLKAYHEDLDIIEAHPILETMRRPNDIMSRWILFASTIPSLELAGKAYWWVQRDPDAPSGSGITIWPIPAHWIEPVHTAERLYDHWLLRIAGSLQPVRVEREEILYFYYPDPSNPLSAISPLQMAARTVSADEAIIDLQRRTFTNGIWPGMALIVGRHPEAQAPGIKAERPILTKEQRLQLMVAVKQFYRGVQHYNEPLILDGMLEDVKNIGQTNRELDFQKSGNTTEMRIHRAFGVNPIITGLVEGANRASSATADWHFCSNCINPKVTLLSEIMTWFFAQLFNDTELLTYIEEAHPNDPDFALQEETFLQKAGAVGNNELRQRHGFPPAHGQDINLQPGQPTVVNVVREDEPEPTSPGLLPGETEEDRQPPPPPPTFGQGQGQGVPQKPGQGGAGQGGKPGSEDAVDGGAGAAGGKKGNRATTGADAFAEWFYKGIAG
jgi:phage portal protein BeeE